MSEDDDDFMSSKRDQNGGKAPVASEKGGVSSKKVKRNDDDFMPRKKAQNRSKGCASSKSVRPSKIVASSKGADADYDSADDFIPGKLVQVTFGRNGEDLWKNHVSKNNDYDFM